MAYSAMAVANAFIARAKQGKVLHLTPMKLQKLLFFVQSWYARNHHQPLFDEPFCRWNYGPVIPSIYHEFKGYGANVIQKPGSTVVPQPTTEPGGFSLAVATPEIDWNDQDAVSYIDEAIRVYGGYSGWTLSQMTHEVGTAWQLSGPPDGGAIPLEQMAMHIHPEHRAPRP